jgi:hypothetical protein
MKVKEKYEWRGKAMKVGSKSLQAGTFSLVVGLIIFSYWEGPVMIYVLDHISY